MTANVDLASREIARRKALWTLAHLIPGDSRAAGIVDVLDEIDLHERLDTSLPPPHVSIEELRDLVTVEAHPIGVSIVRESAIPQPWRERFMRANLGSTRVTGGPYATDWHSFLEHWVGEMQHLESHRTFLRSRK